MSLSRLDSTFMLSKRLLLTAASVTAAASSVAATYTWANPAANGSLGTSSGYDIASGSYWVGGTGPTFNNTTELVFTGMGSDGATTLFGGSTTRTLNRLTVSTNNSLRINSASTTLAFAGTAPTIDIQSGTLRLEAKISASGGITKTGSGTIFSNLQSVSSGFTGPFTIEAGQVNSGNNYALGDEKVVNIRSGATVNMNAQLWGSSLITGGSTVGRNYTFNIAGSGVGGVGAIANLGGSVSTTTGISGVRNLNLDADAAVGGTGNFNIGLGGAVDGNGFTLTKTGANTIYLSGTATDIAFAVSQGKLVGHATNSAFGDAGAAISVAAGATIASDGARTFANTLTLADTAILENLSANTATWTGNAALSSGLAVVKGSFSNSQITMSGVLSGDGGIRKESSNTLLLSNANTYAGLTRVTAGTLRLGSAGSIANSSDIIISSGATLNVADVSGGYTLGADQTLSGGGTITGNTVIAGSHTPGFSPGLQTFSNNLTYADGSDITWELAANSTASRGTFFDGINVQGNLTFEGAVNLTLVFDYVDGAVDWTAPFWDTAISGTTGWKVFGVTGTVNGFANLQIANAEWLDANGTAFATARPQGQFSLHQAADGIYLNYTPVPEPSTYGLILGALALAGAAVRRRKMARN